MKCSVCKGFKTLRGQRCGHCAGTGIEQNAHPTFGASAGSVILDPDTKRKRIKITCRCGSALLLEVPEPLKHLTHAVTCHSCQNIYVMRDGVLARQTTDGDMRIIEPAAPKTAFKETEPAKDSFQVPQQSKYIN